MYAARRASSNGTPTTADAVSCDPTATTAVRWVQPGLGRDLGQQRAEHSPWLSDGRQQPHRYVDPLGQPGSPGPSTHVVQLGRGRVRGLRADLSREPVADEVREQQQGLRIVESGLGRQLVDGVERQLLQPGDGEQLLLGHQRQDLVEDGVGAGVAVAVRDRPAAPRTRRAARSRRPRRRRRSRPRARTSQGRRAPRAAAEQRPSAANRRSAVTGPLANRCTSSSASVSAPTVPTITRPLDAPRSTAATRTVDGLLVVIVSAGSRRRRRRRPGCAGRWCG